MQLAKHIVVTVVILLPPSEGEGPHEKRRWNNDYDELRHMITVIMSKDHKKRASTHFHGVM